MKTRVLHLYVLFKMEDAVVARGDVMCSRLLNLDAHWLELENQHHGIVVGVFMSERRAIPTSGCVRPLQNWLWPCDNWKSKIRSFLVPQPTTIHLTSQWHLFHTFMVSIMAMLRRKLSLSKIGLNHSCPMIFIIFSGESLSALFFTASIGRADWGLLKLMWSLQQFQVIKIQRYGHTFQGQ